MLNIHPALLPDFGGQGMYGRRVHEAVLAAGVPFTGATVHLVDEAYDHGPVVAQKRLPVRAGESAESLEARIMAAEPKLFVENSYSGLPMEVFPRRSRGAAMKLDGASGGCLCGAVQFSYNGEIGGALGKITACLCTQCRKAQGFAAAVGPAEASGFSILQGKDLIREFQSSPGKWRAFCSRCGSPLYSRLDARPEALRLRLGAFDTLPKNVTVEAVIFAEDLPAWTCLEDAPRYAGGEPKRP